MLDSLAIKNFRNLKDFTIPSLGKVNLITGKNNTGKSAVLEAVAIYTTNVDLNLLFQLLEDRGENFITIDSKTDIAEFYIRYFSSLFTNRIRSVESKDAIAIGTTESSLPGYHPVISKPVKLQFIEYIEEIRTDKQGSVQFHSRTPVPPEEKGLISDYKVGLEIEDNLGVFILPFDKNTRTSGNPLKGWRNEHNVQFVKTGNLDIEINGKLFDKIALTEKEKYIVEALKIIEPATERIAFVEEMPGRRKAVIKLLGKQEVLPLRSMGDGINHILTIILAMVNAEGGYLLIDEFENGLHYTVQEQLWNIIFKLAQELNVQVFATTHSEDCIAAFSRVLNIPNQTLAGKLIRLDNVNGTIRQVEYNAEELKIATDQNIETR